MRRLEKNWYARRPEWWSYLLLPLWLLYQVARGLHKLGFWLGLKKVWQAPVPTIVVGNLSVGGTGKTPVVLAVVRWLQAAGYQPGIISRGYGGQGPFPQLVTTASAAAAVGDEPLLLAFRSGVPVVVAPDRPAAARALLAAHPQCDVLVSDDGLQHTALGRSLALVVVDGERGFGNGWQLPIGPLRQSLRALAKQALVVVNGEPQPRLQAQLEHDGCEPMVMTLQPAGWFRVADKKAIETPDGEAVIAIAGIGHPQRFFDSLRVQGFELAQTCSFPDHHAFSAADFADFDRQRPVVMTEKDAAKCRSFAPRHWYYLAVEAQLPAALFSYLAKRLPPPAAAGAAVANTAIDE